MKILHVIPSISRRRGGPSTAIFSMVRELRREGVDAAILTTNDNHIYRDRYSPLGCWFWIDDVPVLMFPTIDSRSKLIREFLISPQLSYWLICNINSYDALHIHSLFSYCSSTSMLIARLMKIPYIVRTIGQLNKWSLSQSRLRKLIMLSLVEHANLRHATAIHVTSEYERQELIHVCNNKNILCLELGVDMPKFEEPRSQSIGKTIRFVFLSRIHPKKQLDLLLQTLAHLYNDENQKLWKLFIAGDGENEYISYLKSLVEDHGISCNVEWMGHLGEEQKFRLLTKSDWYVLPSKSENFGLSVVEALSSGLPVIISSKVGISDIVFRYNAGLVVGQDMSLEDALRFALNGVPDEMRRAASQLATERFSWQPIIQKLSLFYNEQFLPQAKK
jgi:glycosyltransferase involved in cell wall biosynthesis